MINVTYIDPNGSSKTVSADPGNTVMEAAVLNGVEGIVAECGGGCSCATCHVYVDCAWANKLEEMAPEEGDLIEFLDHARPTSRLSCQIVLGEHLDGLVVETPREQQ